jgi:hypothetical protein
MGERDCVATLRRLRLLLARLRLPLTSRENCAVSATRSFCLPNRAASPVYHSESLTRRCMRERMGERDCVATLRRLRLLLARLRLPLTSRD